MARALQRFEGQVQLVLYPLALNDNPQSLVASQTALCAGEQDKFWDMHHLLYEQQPQWVKAPDPLQRILTLAKGLALQADALIDCVNSQRMRPILDANKTQARNLQVNSTPTVFVNAQRLVGADSDMIGTIQRELDRVKRSSP